MTEENINQDLQHQIDLFIDDRLKAEEITSLLQQLELHPAGYRQCVLTLLESREMKKALLNLKAATCDSPKPMPLTEPPAASVFPRQLSRVMLVCALLLAFFGGRFFSQSMDSAKDNQVAVPSNNEAMSTVQTGPIATPEQSAGTPQKRTNANQPEGLAIVGYAQVKSGPGEPRRFPVVAGQVDPEQLNQWAKIPERIQRQARNRGFAIQSTRRVMMLQLADGTAYSVPLESIAIQHVGERML